MNDLEYYKALYEQLQAQYNLIEANIARARVEADVATDLIDPATYASSKTAAVTAPPGGIPIPPGVGPPPGILPNWPMPPIGSPLWNAWLSEWVRLNAPTPPRRGETAAQYQERRRAHQALQKAFARWRRDRREKDAVAWFNPKMTHLNPKWCPDIAVLYFRNIKGII